MNGSARAVAILFAIVCVALLPKIWIGIYKQVTEGDTSWETICLGILVAVEFIAVALLLLWLAFEPWPGT